MNVWAWKMQPIFILELCRDAECRTSGKGQGELPCLPCQSKDVLRSPPHLSHVMLHSSILVCCGCDNQRLVSCGIRAARICVALSKESPLQVARSNGWDLSPYSRVSSILAIMDLGGPPDLTVLLESGRVLVATYRLYLCSCLLLWVFGL